MDVTDTGAQWVEVTVEANAESVEAVSELLARYGYNEGVVIEEPYLQDEDGDNLAVDPTRPVRVRTYLAADHTLPERQSALEQGIWHLQQIGGVGQITLAERAEEDWANTWKEHFPVLRIGKRFVVRPSWREYTPRVDDLVIHLDPGMAFGTGLHPSTELCMLFMEGLDFHGTTVLDVGAGSGILTIAAIRSGAQNAVAVEIDSVAARALAENVALNDMGALVEVIAGDIRDALDETRTFSVILANLIARILCDNAAPIARHLSRNGVVIASGIIEEREQLVIDAFAAEGLTPLSRIQAGDWVALRFERI
jgi:ribosomal protein L11 methyltransferase